VSDDSSVSSSEDSNASLINEDVLKTTFDMLSKIRSGDKKIMDQQFDFETEAKTVNSNEK